MILSQFASHVVAEALPPGRYSGRVGLGGGVVNWLKRAFLPRAGVLQLAPYKRIVLLVVLGLVIFNH